MWYWIKFLRASKAISPYTVGQTTQGSTDFICPCIAVSPAPSTPKSLNKHLQDEWINEPMTRPPGNSLLVWSIFFWITHQPRTLWFTHACPIFKHGWKLHLVTESPYTQLTSCLCSSFKPCWNPTCSRASSLTAERRCTASTRLPSSEWSLFSGYLELEIRRRISTKRIEMGVAEQRHKASFSPSYVPDTMAGGLHTIIHTLSLRKRKFTRLSVSLWEMSWVKWNKIKKRKILNYQKLKIGRWWLTVAGSLKALSLLT